MKQSFQLVFLLDIFAYSVSETQLYICILLEQALRPKVKQISTACTFYTEVSLRISNIFHLCKVDTKCQIKTLAFFSCKKTREGQALCLEEWREIKMDKLELNFPCCVLLDVKDFSIKERAIPTQVKLQLHAIAILVYNSLCQLILPRWEWPPQSQWLPAQKQKRLETTREKQEAFCMSSDKCVKDTLKKRMSWISSWELTEESILASSLSWRNMFSFSITNLC